MANNLWPDFTKEPVPRTVRRVLIEAALGLAERTGQLLRCEIETAPHAAGKFVHSGYLVAPSLDYRYPLFKVQEEGNPYPVKLIGDVTFKTGALASDEKTLTENLQLLFSSDPTKKAVLELLDILEAA